MIAAPHMIVGAILGDLITNYPLAFLAGFASHFIFDAIPHLEHSTFWKKGERKEFHLTKGEYFFIFSEILIGLLIVLWFFLSRSKNWAILIGAFGAILPDFIDNVPFWSPFLRKFPIFKQFHQVHNFIHHRKMDPKNWIFGLIVYIIIIGIFMWVIISNF